MSTFQVTPAELQSLAGQLSGLLGELQAAADRIDRGTAGAAQNGRLESAIDSFLASWSAEVQELQSKLDGLSARLQAGGVSYEGTESRLVAGFDSN